MVPIGGFDVHFYMSTMGSYNSEPRKVYLGAMLKIFGYLKCHIKLQIIYDTLFFDNQGEVDIDLNCSDILHGGLEDPPPNMIETEVNPVRITTFFHADNFTNL